VGCLLKILDLISYMLGGLLMFAGLLIVANSSITQDIGQLIVGLLAILAGFLYLLVIISRE